MKHRILSLALLLAVLVGGIVIAQPYEQPKVLLYLEGIPRDSSNIGRWLTSIGDVNNDGYDDLLTCHTPLSPGFRSTLSQTQGNQVELYYGGITMNDQPKIIIPPPPPEQQTGIGYYITPIGKLAPWAENVVAMQTITFEVPIIATLDFFPITESQGVKPLVQCSNLSYRSFSVAPTPTLSVSSTSKSYNHNRSFDFNADGWNDVLILRELKDSTLNSVDTTFVELWYGGEDFDTIPDFIIPLETLKFGVNITTGFDFNDDGYDDILLFYQRLPRITSTEYYVQVYLGGANPQITPALSYRKYGGTSTNLVAVPDMNGDGYDDWVYWHINRLWVYYGSETLDSIPDVYMPAGMSSWPNGADMVGGDFNGDGYGDLVVGAGLANYDEGEVCIYFGHPGMKDGKSKDILIPATVCPKNFGSFGTFVGGVGDYNGDGVDDFCVRSGGPFGGYAASLMVFAGYRGWRVSAPEQEVILPREPFIKAYPNPFNSSATLSYYLPADGELSIMLFDTQGRMVRELTSRNALRGAHSLEFTATELSSGIYLGVMTLQGATRSWRVTTKMVLVK